MEQLTQTQRIHADFRNALNLSAIKVSDIVVSEEPINEDFLSSIGMVNSKTYEREKIKSQQKQNAREMKSTLESLKEVEAMYPQYRIISLSKVVGLMGKYGLCFGCLSDYTSTIPQQNIEELKKYQEEVSHKVGANYADVRCLLKGQTLGDWRGSGYNKYFIAAPREFFRENLTNVDGFLVDRVETPKFKMQFGTPKRQTDPIVLKPLSIPGSDRFMHIATAWDVEADDELVTNKINIIRNNN